MSCGLVPRLLVNLIKRRPQITEEQLKTIAGGFTAMTEKCCKQADIIACLGEEVLSSSFFKTKPKTTCTHKKTTKKTPTKTPKPHVQEPGICTRELFSKLNNCGHLATCRYNKWPELRVYLGSTDQSLTDQLHMERLPGGNLVKAPAQSTSKS